MKEKDEFILFFKIVLGKKPSAARKYVNVTKFSTVSLYLAKLYVK